MLILRRRCLHRGSGHRCKPAPGTTQCSAIPTQRYCCVISTCPVKHVVPYVSSGPADRHVGSRCWRLSIHCSQHPAARPTKCRLPRVVQRYEGLEQVSARNAYVPHDERHYARLNARRLAKFRRPDPGIYRGAVKPWVRRRSGLSGAGKRHSSGAITSGSRGNRSVAAAGRNTGLHPCGTMVQIPGTGKG